MDVEEVDSLFASLNDRVEVVEAPNETEYGMQELISLDPNRFWVTFGSLVLQGSPRLD